jgi:uncharacterized protein YndB with AHSA1/START domain
MSSGTTSRATSPDRIEKTTVIRAPRARVWRALTNHEEFGTWFGVTIDQAFTPGATITGKIHDPQYAHIPFTLTIDRVEPERLFSMRWHPYALEPGVDYSAEPTTLIEFTLEEVAEGTRLTVVESGFDRIPIERRALAYRMNDEGWGAQVQNIKTYVEQTA